MLGIAINRNPLLTEYLVRELRVFAKDPVVFLDIGARGGARAEWAVFGDQLKIFAFEPDEEECKTLAAKAPPQVVYLPVALGKTAGSATFYELAQPASSGFYETRMGYFNRFLNRDNAVVVGTHTMAFEPLDAVAQKYGIDRVDFVKIDVEGAELEVLEGGKNLLFGGGVLGILSEIRLHREINGSPPFAELDSFLRDQGLRLFDLEVNHHSRIALPYPSLLDWRYPSGKRFFAYTTRGQLQDGDALYFRDTLIEADAAARRPLTPVGVLKLCALMEIYSLSDCAAELLMAHAKELEPLIDVSRALDLLATGINGSPIGYREYIDRFFTDDKAPGTTPAPSSNPSGLAGAIKKLLRAISGKAEK